MRWPKDVTGWPMADKSRIVRSRPHRWHVQEDGDGPTLILLHGAGGATQSWRGLFPLLAETHHVVAIDLPGQGFTRMSTRQRCGLDATAEDLTALIQQEGWAPKALIGHSAGAAVALRMTERSPGPDVIGINAALGNFKGVAGWLFPFMAKALALTPFTAEIFAATGSSPRQVAKLIAGTGSTLPPEGLALYQRLASDRDHVAATLAMMAQWNLDGLSARLDDHPARCLFLTADGDKAVPPDISVQVAKRMADAQHIQIAGAGHLVHEEQPETVAALIRDFLEPD